MPRPPKKVAPIEESIRLSSEVTVVVRATATVYDLLNIQRVGGVVTVALPNATAPHAIYAPTEQYVPQPDTPGIAAAREALAARHPSGPVTPASLGFQALTPEMLGGGGDFAGPSNEEQG